MNIVRHNPQKILSDASEYGKLVFTGGNVAEDLSQGIRGQTEQILKAIDALLAKAGSSKSRILSVNIWLTDIRNREEMNAVWSAWVDPTNLPPRATVEAKLADPRMLIEIAVVAAK
ncbi:MAG: RidA family protein [Betaproteobacteria bacterium]|nr:RidA family protein [Betaproteobacteria bacterium]